MIDTESTVSCVSLEVSTTLTVWPPVFVNDGLDGSKPTDGTPAKPASGTACGLPDALLGIFSAAVSLPAWSGVYLTWTLQLVSA